MSAMNGDNPNCDVAAESRGSNNVGNGLTPAMRLQYKYQAKFDKLHCKQLLYIAFSNTELFRIYTRSGGLPNTDITGTKVKCSEPPILGVALPDTITD